MDQRKTLVVAIMGAFLLVAVGAVFQAVADGTKAKPGESIVTFEDPSFAEQGPVQFSHPKHKAAFGAEKLDCKQCHIKPKLFPMKRKAGEPREMVKMEAMVAGKACGACHDGKTEVNGKVVFSVANEKDCVRCHKK
jgi:c(7)-type cytochrome triheme protein